MAAQEDQPNYDSAGRGHTGSINLRNTCYLSAVFQCLAHTDPLRHYFIINPIESEANWSETSMTAGFTAFYFAIYVRLLWAEHESSLRLISLKRQMGLLNGEFAGTWQCDAQELCGDLLQGLHDDLSHANDELGEVNIGPQDGALYANATAHWTNLIANESSPIVDLFYFQTVETIECTQCQNVRHNFNYEKMLMLPIPEAYRDTHSLHLVNMLDHYFGVTPSDAPLSCEICQKRTNCNKSLQIWRWPKILVINMKKTTLTNYGERKLDISVSYPVSKPLDMKKYCHPMNRAADGKMYQLYGVVIHLGEAGAGHYIAVAKTSHGTKGKGWRMFDDHRVSRIPESDAATSDAYMLFYKRLD